MNCLLLILVLIAIVESFVVPTKTTSSAHRQHQKTLLSLQKRPQAVRPPSDYLASSPTSSVDATQHDKSTIPSKLDDILRSKSTQLFEEINSLRQNKESSQEDVEHFLNDILAIVDDGASSKLWPWWTKIRITSRISRRARLASLRRVLDMSTPSVEETQSLGDDEDAQKRRRRRALLILFRSLSATSNDDEEEGDQAPTKKNNGKNAIYNIEKSARNDLTNSVSFKDMESRLPPGLETPKYDVIVRRPVNGGSYEIRNYEAFSVCTVPMAKPRPTDMETTDQKLRNPQLAGASSFGALAGYLFGKNEEQKAMKMTTPVLTRGDEDTKEMSFVLPSAYWTNEGMVKAPTPLENSLVTVKRDEGGLKAVLMFGGFASKKDIASKKKQLSKSLDNDKEWMAVDSEDFTLAQYNDPFTPPWKRRNEVSILVEKRS